MVYHILKDGTKVNDITGHVVRIEDAPALYELMASLSKRKTNTYKNEKKEESSTWEKTKNRKAVSPYSPRKL